MPVGTPHVQMDQNRQQDHQPELDLKGRVRPLVEVGGHGRPGGDQNDERGQRPESEPAGRGPQRLTVTHPTE